MRSWWARLSSKMSQNDGESNSREGDVPVEHPVDEDDVLIHLARKLKKDFRTYSVLFAQDLKHTIEQLLNLNYWFQDAEQPLAWKENYDAIEEVRKAFIERIVILQQPNPTLPNEVVNKDTKDLCKELKGWFQELLELHFGLRARQLRWREKYKIFYEHRITNTIAEHIMNEPGMNEAFANFQSLLQQCGALR